MAYADQPNRSPWIAQLEPDGPPRPLTADATTDVAIVGAGIAGVATAFFTLRSTTNRVLLLERDRVARGATGRNAGQLTTYFERPLVDIAAEFGAELAVDGQRTFDYAHELLDLMASEAETTVRIERFLGHMGMWNPQHLGVHLRNNAIRQAGGLRLETCIVSEEAEYLASIPGEFASLYSVVPQARIRELLETRDDRYTAVLSDRKGCVNSGALVQQVLAHLERRYPDRFRYADRTAVERVLVSDDGVSIDAAGQRVRAARVVMCTNGFLGHAIVDEHATPIKLHPDQRIIGRVAYMTGFFEPEPRQPAATSYIRNTTIGGDLPYAYVTRRTYDRPEGSATLTCMGGPEHAIPAGEWREDLPFPGPMLSSMDEQIRPFAQPSRQPGGAYDFQWHGLMGYMAGGIRVIGAHPRHPGLLYNLGCNGVGFLPSIAGGDRIARMLAGEILAPSIFDPRLEG